MGSRPPSSARTYLLTLGCPKNEADSRMLTRSLEAAGITMVETPQAATHILVNTCGFIQDAKEESIAAILDACAGYPGKKVLVTGCLVERYRDELARGIPEVSGWFGLVGGPEDADLLRALGAGDGRHSAERARAGGRPAARVSVDNSSDAGHSGESYAYLKISDGCDELCTFCAIPGIKGPYHSVPATEILREADACLDEGARELVLVGQDTAIWRDGALDLAGLIDLLATDERVRRIRVMYLQPEHLTDDFLRYMASQPKLCRYLDVPFQHSHPDILRAMGRWGGGDDYLALLERARCLMPDVSTRSTFIVGFPGERAEHFEHLLNFVDRAGFDYAGGFVYSPEEGTTAAGLRPRVRRAVARERLNRLNTLLESRSEEEHQRMVDSRAQVLVDAIGTDVTPGSMAVGRTAGQAPEVDGVVHIEGDLPAGTLPGDMIEVTVSGTLGYDLIGTCDVA